MEIDSCRDTIESQDVIDRIKELEESLEEIHSRDYENPNRAYDAELDGFDDWLEELSGNDNDENWEDVHELMALRDLESEANGASDWEYGTTLIKESCFDGDYARGIVEEIGDLPGGIPGYIENNINWDGVADDLKEDYMSVDFDGETYLIRN